MPQRRPGMAKKIKINTYFKKIYLLLCIRDETCFSYYTHFPLHSPLCLVGLRREEENIIVMQSENAAIDSEVFEGET